MDSSVATCWICAAVKRSFVRILFSLHSALVTHYTCRHLLFGGGVCTKCGPISIVEGYKQPNFSEEMNGAITGLLLCGSTKT